jgi:hypothetical protein
LPYRNEASAGLPAIPGYELQGLLNRGGMGVVYRARQLQPDRLVAIKMILSGRHASAEQRARFRREAEAVARLNHPNVVQIYEVGEHDEQPFFSMEYVAGGSLAQRLAEGPLPATQAAELMTILADAIAHAHRCGVVHRDLKPGNILLSTKDEGRSTKEDRSSPSFSSFVLGTSYFPKITDFGLAKRLDLDAGQTPTVAFLGTPSYMAPEQAEGRTREVGPPADVYALGAILYEMLTGRPPFRGETEIDTLNQVRSLDPVPPSRYQPKVPRDLETICLKCLRKEPGKRYAGAHELADDLRRFLAGKPVAARPAPWWEVALKWARRNPALAALLAVSAAAAVVLLVMWAGFTAELKKERDDAVKSWKAAETERDRAKELLRHSLDAIVKSVGDIEKGRQAKESEGTPGALYFVMACVYAETADRYARDDKLNADDRREFVSHYDSAAMELLKHAQEYNYFHSRPANLKKLKEDPRLNRLRAQPKFKDWLRSIGVKAD